MIRLFSKLTYGSAADEVATLDPHEIKPDTDSNFCDLCIGNSDAFGLGGCRSEFYTNERLKKCGVVIGNSGKGDSTAEDKK
eukprot:CAMPEP_0184322480 /NCGR_PEP_ID=MMETSP1049-20130417/124680_1 /TAXON_ID=77928 /ORGANISM="Proteomonas sulcata, Strain CCMP704" /LENGTH=80 /DNA_ID=CAMNT_0026643631 /DNA_START=151 /DNA_END=393 /DNA_ORIENTATION=-